MNAKTICRLNPQATVRQRICHRSVEPSHAASSTANIPSTPVYLSNRNLLETQSSLLPRRPASRSCPGFSFLFPIQRLHFRLRTKKQGTEEIGRASCRERV